MKCGTIRPSLPVRLLKIHIFKVQDGGGRHVEKWKNRQMLAPVWPVAAKFNTVTHVDPLNVSTIKTVNF